MRKNLQRDTEVPFSEATNSEKQFLEIKRGEKQRQEKDSAGKTIDPSGDGRGER